MKKNSINKVEQFNFGLCLHSANGEAFPIVYADDCWHIATTGSALATLMGSIGSYGQDEINEKLAEKNGAGSIKVEVIDSIGSISNPSTDTLYLVTGATDNLFDCYSYNGTSFVNGGSVSLSLEKYTKANSSLRPGTSNTLVGADGDRSLVSTEVTIADIEELIKDFLGTVQGSTRENAVGGTLAALLNDYRSGNIGGTISLATDTVIGGLKLGFDIDSTNKRYPIQLDSDGKGYVEVPWSGNENVASPENGNGLMTVQQVYQLAAYKNDIATVDESDFKNVIYQAFNQIGTNAFVAPLYIKAGEANNIFGIISATDEHVMAMIEKTGNVSTSATEGYAFEVRFSIGHNDNQLNFNCYYNGASFMLYYEELIKSTNISTLAI